MIFSCFGGRVSLREEGNGVESDGSLGRLFSGIAYSERDFKRD